MSANNRHLDEKLDNLKKDLENTELNLQRAEQEKQTKDSQIRTLTDELSRQEETMARVNRDKKNLEELLKKTQDDLASEEDKCNSLNKTKQKLEQSVDEVIIFQSNCITLCCKASCYAVIFSSFASARMLMFSSVFPCK